MKTKNKILIFLLAGLFVFFLFVTEAEASLSVHPGNIADTITVNNNTSILHITNVGPSSNLGYQVSTDVLWIGLSSVSGIINIGDTVSITITYNTSELQSGINNGNIFVLDPHHGTITIPVEIYSQTTTDVNEDFFSNTPASFSIEQNYPNPFNPSTKISFSIPETQKVTLKIYNLLGNELLTLVDEEKAKGIYSVNVDMSSFASGVYFYKITAGKYSQTRKMILNK